MTVNLPGTMRGVQLIGHGGFDRLHWNEAIPTPRPGPGEVLVRVLAAGINNTDINTRIGWYSKDVTGATGEAGDGDAVAAGGWAGALEFPRIQGADLCGEVVETGPGVDSIQPGRRVTAPTNQPEPDADHPLRIRVIGSEYDGAFAQYCVVPARQLYDVSDSPLSDIEIGAIPCAYGTAYNLLHRAAVGAGDRLLVTGASGGVGLAAVQLAALRGAEITAVCSASKAGAVRAAGAARILERDAPVPTGAYTAVVDLVGGAGFGALLEGLVPGGRYATSGAIAGPNVETDLRTVYLQDLTLYGCTFPPAAVFAELIEIVNRGEIRPLVSKTWPLADIVAAQQAFLSKRLPGKLVLVP